MERHRLLNGGKNESKMVEGSGLLWECWTGKSVERQLRLGITECMRGKGTQVNRRESRWRRMEICSYCTLGAVKCLENAEKLKS